MCVCLYICVYFVILFDFGLSLVLFGPELDICPIGLLGRVSSRVSLLGRSMLLFLFLSKEGLCSIKIPDLVLIDS